MRALLRQTFTHNCQSALPVYVALHIGSLECMFAIEIRISEVKQSYSLSSLGANQAQQNKYNFSSWKDGRHIARTATNSSFP